MLETLWDITYYMWFRQQVCKWKSQKIHCLFSCFTELNKHKNWQQLWNVVSCSGSKIWTEKMSDWQIQSVGKTRLKLPFENHKWMKTKQQCKIHSNGYNATILLLTVLFTKLQLYFCGNTNCSSWSVNQFPSLPKISLGVDIVWKEISRINVSMQPSKSSSTCSL